ncbi:uncharacterized protein LOC135162616 [Diachasmimorpha longicaudata]|uniref:uncharacterized protein LOC135162616 n=1 Tax=Diachasmimorpha longicaudata TaxID=58733 RepID=UPI0030B8AC44
MVLGLTTDCYSWDKNCLDSKNNINSKLLPSIQFNQIHYDLKNKDHDQLFLSTVFCKNYQDKFNLLIDEQTQKMSEELRKIYHYLSEHTGTNFHTNVDAWILHQYLEAKANSGGPLEPWMQDLLANGILTNLTIENFQTKSATPQMRRLLGGNFINKFLQNIDDYLHGAKTRLFMYVGDDYHIAGLLSALRLYDGKHIPNYGSYIALEVHEFYGKLSIVVKYNNGRSDPSQTELLSLPGYNLPFCPLSNFKTIVEENTLKNFPGECSN